MRENCESACLFLPSPLPLLTSILYVEVVRRYSTNAENDVLLGKRDRQGATRCSSFFARAKIRLVLVLVAATLEKECGMHHNIYD